MRLAGLVTACTVFLTATSAASAASVTGQAALALAGVVALYAPMPAIASVAKSSLASRPFSALVDVLKVTSQERAVRSTLLVLHTIFSAITEIFAV